MTAYPTVVILWLRQDLRLRDNPALHAALAYGERLLPVYIHSPTEAKAAAPGAASCWWLYHSLESLRADLRARGSDLILKCGPCLPTLQTLIQTTGASMVLWNRLYEPDHVERDRALKATLQAQGISCQTYNGALLAEPWEIKTNSGGSYRVFTPFARAWRARAWPRQPLPAPTALPPVPAGISSTSLDALGLLPKLPWYQSIATAWQPGEQTAQAQLARFCEQGLHTYAEHRDRPDLAGTSRLSPYLHYGEISPVDVVATCQAHASQAGNADHSLDRFLGELAWREFNYHLLYRHSNAVTAPLNPRFAAFPWRTADIAALLERWQRGTTGIPIIDAGMRELWATGWMHNRVRMLVASLLSKNLLLPWQYGERWFRDTLVDADLANNVMGWQWTAGCGTDAAPYFRIFNPVTQAERFDPQRTYIRRWVPELSQLADRWIHQPWSASSDTLKAAHVQLDQTYPKPLVDLKTSRKQALAAYQQIKGQ